MSPFPAVPTLTEQEWLEARDPWTLRWYLLAFASARKFRLLGVAGFRRVWDLISDDVVRRAVEAAELFADGLIYKYVFRAAAREAHRLVVSRVKDAARTDAAGLLAYRLSGAADFLTMEHRPHGYTSLLAVEVLKILQHAVDGRPQEVVCSTQGWSNVPEAVIAERAAQADLVRDIFSNPFRPTAIDPASLARNDGAAAKLARTIYDDRRWDDMPILGETLEDASCHDTAILEHCRRPGPHVRGCWVVDLILGKS